MNIEDIKIEDAADANYVIRKFLNDQFKDVKMSQLEQLVLTVYKMGKNSGGASAGSTEVDGSDNDEPDNDISGDDIPDNDVPDNDTSDVSADSGKNANPFEINDKAIAIDEIEIANSGEIIKVDTQGTINSVKGDIVAFLFESDDTGEMIEVNVEYYKLEKI